MLGPKLPMIANGKFPCLSIRVPVAWWSLLPNAANLNRATCDSLPVLTHQTRNALETIVVNPEAFQAMDRVEERVPAGAERPAGSRNHPGCVSLRRRTHIVRCRTIDGESNAKRTMG